MGKWGKQEFAESQLLSEPFDLRPNELDAALDGLCSIIAGITAATTVLIAQRSAERGNIQVKGRYGTLVSEVDMTFVLPQLNTTTSPMLAVQDLKSDARFSSHPLLQLMPFTKSLIALLIPGCDQKERAVLKIINPRRSAFSDPAIWKELSQFCNVIGNILCVKKSEAVNAETSHAAPQTFEAMQNSSATPNGSCGSFAAVNRMDQSDLPCVSFLFDTLVKKRVLHSRNGVDFITMRCWRGPMKDYQISTLITLKKAKPVELIRRVAAELATAAQNLHGQGSINCVVPVPGGNSGDEQSFSVLVANEVAKLLKIPCENLLLPPTPSRNRGKSSPHKSASLKPYTISKSIVGPVLVVDDVVSSGKHMELAISTLRKQANAVYGIAWIGK